MIQNEPENLYISWINDDKCCEIASCFSIIEMGLFLIYIEIACPPVKTFTVQVPERQKNKFRCQK